MSEQTTEEKCIVISEGQIAWIMERDTPEERLAAWEVFAAVSCPAEGMPEYQPPKQTRGSRLSPVDRVKRDAYNILRGIQKITVSELNRMRFQNECGESCVSCDSSVAASATPQYSTDTPTFGRSDGRRYGSAAFNRLTLEDKQAIELWNKKIPDHKALKDYLMKNYMYQNKSFVQSDEFCIYAYNLLKSQCWISTRTGKPLTNLVTAVFYIALDYKEKNAKIKRVEKVEKAKDEQTDMEVLEIGKEQHSPSDIAALERKRRRLAEKEEEERYLRGCKCDNRKR